MKMNPGYIMDLVEEENIEVERICEHCAHYAWADKVLIPMYTDKGKTRSLREFAPCKLQGNELESPDSVALMGLNANCSDCGDAWEASADYLAELMETINEVRAPYGSRGLNPRDFVWGVA